MCGENSSSLAKKSYMSGVSRMVPFAPARTAPNILTQHGLGYSVPSWPGRKGPYVTPRTYNVPPSWFLDAAQRANLRVMVGLPWEQHVAFLDDSRTACAIEARVREAVRKCAGHPAVLCYAVGNEIPAGMVRWLGRRRVERFIEKLYRVAKAEDPEALVTYVNFPTTEFLELPFLDFFCFNVYLEAQDAFEAYL